MMFEDKGEVGYHYDENIMQNINLTSSCHNVHQKLAQWSSVLYKLKVYYSEIGDVRLYDGLYAAVFACGCTALLPTDN